MAEKPRRKLRDDIFDPKKLPATCGDLFQCEFVVPQLAARFFRSEMLSRNLRERISCPICRFARRTNCIAEPKKVAPSWRKPFRRGFVVLQLGGSICGAILLCSNLEGAFSARICLPPSWSGEFHTRFAGLHTGQTTLWSRNADFPTNNCIFLTQMVCRVTFGTVGGVGSGLSCDFFSPNGMISPPIGTLNVERKEGGSRHVVGSPLLRLYAFGSGLSSAASY